MNEKMISDYLSRVGLSDMPVASESGLTQLHIAQHRHIPFENFDVLLGRGIQLSEEAIFQKLVLDKRGGYCFELNGLMLRILNAAGFESRPLLGRVHLGDGPSGRSHQVSLVIIEGKKWLVDVGFGALTPRSPLPIELNKELHTDIQTYRFITHELYGNVLQIKDDEQWNDLYSLDMSYVCDGDIEYGNHYTSTSKNSSFTSGCKAALSTETGVITLLNNKLKIRDGNDTQEILLTNKDSFFGELESKLGLTIDAPFDAISKYF
ncbi:arylamine N-acetyltransferase [Vibrio sp. HN007]|uniref:arylamine N-acetyltransferase family protein n=1 Tax=Vibrio iocasae TaxID=3098914 RepID=UPI0035D421E9